MLLLTPLNELAAAVLSAAGSGVAPAAAAATPRLLLQLLGGAGGRASYGTHPAFHHHRPRRAMLYVPGDAEKKLRKAASEVSPDVIVMDCEDGVALSRKDAARATIARMLDELHFGSAEAAVRINAAGSAWAEEDLRAVLAARRLPDALVVPKVEGPDQVAWLFDRVDALLAARPAAQQQQQLQQDGDSSGSSRGGCVDSRQPQMALITMCESAAALLDLRVTFEAAEAAGPSAPLQLQACIFGGDDFAASVGASRSAGNAELAHARGQFLLVCRALAVQAIDIVKIDLSEAGMAALAAEATEAARHGYSGKQVIHPKQVPVVQAAFSPSPAELGAALRLIEAFKAHQQAGQGAFIHEGKMIDAPTMLQARNVLALAERLEHVRLEPWPPHDTDNCFSSDR